MVGVVVPPTDPAELVVAPLARHVVAPALLLDHDVALWTTRDGLSARVELEHHVQDGVARLEAVRLLAALDADFFSALLAFRLPQRDVLVAELSRFGEYSSGAVPQVGVFVFLLLELQTQVAVDDMGLEVVDDVVLIDLSVALWAEELSAAFVDLGLKKFA